MVKLLLDYLITGAWHAPVDSKQGESGKVQSGVGWRSKEIFKREP